MCETNRLWEDDPFRKSAVGLVTGGVPLLVTTLFFVGPAMAQAVAAGPATLPSVAVQARYWDEDPRQVPGSVVRLTPEQIGDTASGGGIAAVGRLTPNVSIEQSSVQTRVVIRGVSAANTGLQDPVGYFLDGVGLPMGAMQAPSLFMMDGVEVLKGPQGALYGRNTEAGAIKTTTLRPDRTPTALVSLSSGLVDGAKGWEPSLVATGRVSAPLGSRAAGAVAVRGEGSQGPGHNLVDGATDGASVGRLAGSLALDLNLSDTVDLAVRSTVEDSHLGKARMRQTRGAFASDRYETRYDTPSWDDTTTGVHSLTLTHDLGMTALGPAELTAVSGLVHTNRTFRMDLDAGPMRTPAAVYAHDDLALSQEVRVASTEEGGRLRWLGGAFVSRQDSDVSFRTGMAGQTRTSDLTHDTVALFGNTEWEFVPRWRLGTGLRVEHSRQSGEQTLSGTVPQHYERTLETTTVLPRVTLSWDATEEATLYVSAARGYLPGGYNVGMANSADTFSYDPEYSWTTEAGAKMRGLSDRLSVDVAAFRTTITDKQVVDVVPGGIQKFSNAAEAEIVGFEIAADLKMTQELSVYANGGIQRAEAKRYTASVQQGAAVVQQDLSGRDLPMAPDYTWGVGLRYGQDRGVFGSAGINGTGAYAFDSQNLLTQSAYATVDAELGWRFDGLSVSLWAANLFDQASLSRAVMTPAGPVVEDNAPRQIGLRMTATW